MKRLTMTLTIAAAALVATAGSASAQILKADIPFTFRAGNTVMAPGSYRVTLNHSSAAKWFVFQNTDTRRGVMLARYTIGDAPKAWISTGTPKLAFECAGSQCVLRSVWDGSGVSAYRFTGPKLGSGEDVRVAEIRMTSVKAD
jgi:hypothetical protein